MKLEKIATGKRKNIIIGALMITSFFILLPNFTQVINNIMAPYTDDEVVITTVSYKTEGLNGGDDNIIVGNLYQPAPKFSDKKYPIVIACHGFLYGFGKESMHRWCVEVAKRGFVVLALDLPGSGMSIGDMDLVPRKDFEPRIIEDGIDFLKGYEFVDGSKVGLMGISYGGATVSMVGGVLGNKIDATVAMNGFTNTTNWLIKELLPDAGFKFSVTKDYIKLKEVDGKEVTKENVLDFLKLYGIFRGDDKLIEDLIIPGTTKLDRDFLKKFDAVEYLDNCKNNSVMFIHSKNDDTFGKTNQSGLGYDAITNAGRGAVYIRVDDNHQLMDDPKYKSDYCIINFLEEKLKGKDLGDDWDNDYDKYTQKRNIHLTASKTFGFMTLYVSLGTFFLSLIPEFLVFAIIIYNKKLASKRAEREETILKSMQKNPDNLDLTFERGSYTRMTLFLVLAYFFAYLFIIGVGLGLFSEIIAGFLGAAFYVVLFMALYHLPDKAEVEVWNRLKRKEPSYPKNEELEEVKVFDLNNLLVLFGIIGLVIIVGIGSAVISPLPTYFKAPMEQIFRTMLISGGILLISGIIIIRSIEKKANEGINLRDIDWNKYDLGKYEIAKSYTFGSVLFLNFIFSYNIWAFYMKFPSIIGPHSIYYLFMVFAVLLFFSGIQLLLKIIKERTFKEGLNLIKEGKRNLKLTILMELAIFLLGLGIISVLSFIAFYPLLNTTLFGNMTWVIVALLCGLYILACVLEIFCPERGIFGVSIFVPLALFTIIAFLFHI